MEKSVRILATVGLNPIPVRVAVEALKQSYPEAGVVLHCSSESKHIANAVAKQIQLELADLIGSPSGSLFLEHWDNHTNFEYKFDEFLERALK